MTRSRNARDVALDYLAALTPEEALDLIRQSRQPLSDDGGLEAKLTAAVNKRQRVEPTAEPVPALPLNGPQLLEHLGRALGVPITINGERQ